MSILGTPVNFAATPTQALTWTLETGTTAVIIVIEHEQTALSELIDAVSLGSVGATFYGSNTAGGSGSARPLIEVWRITSNLNSIGTNPTITITPDAAATGDYYGTIFCVDGIDTNTANWSGAEDSDTTANAMQITLTTATNGIVLGGATCTASGNSFTTTVGGVDVETTGSDRNIGAVSRVVSFQRVATGTSTVIDCDNGNSSGTVYQAMYGVHIPPAASGPTITSTSDDTPTDGSTLTLTVTNAEASQGTGGVTANGVGWTETSWADTSVAVTVALGDNKYGVNIPIVLTNNSGLSSSAYNVQIQPASGKSYVNLSGTLATEGDRITAIPDLASGDQLEISNVVGGTISDVTVNADASFSVVAGVTAFDVRVNDGTWSSVATQYVADAGADATSKRGLVRALVRPLTFDIARDISA